MRDFLPFPNITKGTPSEQISQIVEYLITLKEDLEFEFGDIGTDNLSPELIKAINEGKNVQKSEDVQSELQQIAKKSLTVSDVINSEAFNSAINGKISNIEFSVNYDTGNLEYTIKE
jgi:hypothetical protein